MENTREIVFEMEDSDYRVVCKFNQEKYLPCVWWGYLQKKIKYKRWFFFGRERFLWSEFKKCWWSNGFDSREELESAAKRLYRDNVLLYKKEIERAMNI